MKIVIIGCGYIGNNLAKKLKNKNHFITCTTKNPYSLQKISKDSQKSLIMLGTDERAVFLLLQENDLIIVTVSTTENKEFEQTYLQTAQTIKKCSLKLKQPKKIIYVSKASIYGNHDGKWVDESASLKGKDDESKVLIDTENTILSLKELDWQVCILRTSKIYGPGKTILELFKQIYKKVIPGHSNYYTNMVHIEDLIGVLDHVIEHNLQGIFNVCDNEHLTRQEFINAICTKLNLEKPTFDPKLLIDDNKRIANYRIKETGYVFQYPTKDLNLF